MSQSFENLDVSNLKDTLIFLDIDGTLIADNQSEPSKPVLKKIKEFEKENVVWLCSNSLNHTRNKKVSDLSGLRLIKGYRKPNKKILTLVSKKDLFTHTFTPSSLRSIIVIGDKVLTDGLFALRIKAKFIKVKRKLGRDRLRIKLYNLIDDIAFLVLKPFF